MQVESGRAYEISSGLIDSRKKFVSKVSANSPLKNGKQIYFGLSKKDLAKKATEEILEKYPNTWANKTLKTLGKVEPGEVTNLSVNFVGTVMSGGVIAFNPVSKADEDTKKYTGARQPISAVLAFLPPLIAIKPFGRYLDGLYNKGEMGPLNDLRVKPDEGFVARQLKKDHPDLGKKELAEKAKKQIEDNFNKLIESARKPFAIKNPAEEGKEFLNQTDFLKKMKHTASELINMASDTKKNMPELTEYVDNDLSKNKNFIQENKVLKQIVEIIDKNKKGASEKVKEIKPLLKKLSKDTDLIKATVETHVDHVKKSIKGDKIVFNGMLALATVPFTCMLLNWVYPRAMEKLFPDLTNRVKNNATGKEA